MDYHASLFELCELIIKNKAWPICLFYYPFILNSRNYMYAEMYALHRDIIDIFVWTLLKKKKTWKYIVCCGVLYMQ